eukprot:m.25755 g.25755  ORF g.25755 m.25755 type:complete len:377 (-) comp15161_c0_seq1:218-1348(-)
MSDTEVKMEYRTLGRGGPKVSVIAMGCFAFGGDRKTGSHLGSQFTALHNGVWGDQDDKDTFATVKAALDAGITMFDTAEMYGDGYSEEVTGRALKASGYARDKYVVATKVSESNLEPKLLREHLNASLKRLDMDYIDIYQVHWHSRAALKSDVYPERPLAAEVPLEDTFKELAKMKEEGLIKHIAVCNFGVSDITKVLEIGVPIISNQLSYGLLWRGLEFEVAEICEENGISIMPWGPLQQGLLCGKFTTADDVPPGRARNRLFSNKRTQQRHGEPGMEEDMFVAVNKIREIAKTVDDSANGMTNVALAWVMARPNVATVLMGARNAAQLQSNLSCLKLTLSPSVIKELDDVTEVVKSKLGLNLDPYENSENSRIR